VSADADRIVALKAELSFDEVNRVLDRAEKAECERDAARAAHERTKAEAAAMREALKAALALPTPYLHANGHRYWHTEPHEHPCRGCDLEEAFAGTAGRALAARVPLWRELEKWCLQMQGHAKSPHLDHVLSQLDALDEKGGAK
jgi:hypothetical protein